ncbi:polymer-forming cytoskeletal protein [Cohnella lubricantis]|uniref:Polymer-forming cytoskeletal protein n=1 Tax=Cohnella lubricantis TaxID=2163172 RepID=A0A841TJB9_9BACL|nr:polymer-forming cytoskeletal protein [Cohnella lubricantis]MBB6679290.1 polymer-forming cytoskeletal protein [Cohnella lubricantis]MBP2120401.1 cytoskeletal protein CcmA (bactofilin family) [Cohnella lubricantis]
MMKKKTKIAPGTTDTLIGEGSTFEGKIRSRASVRLEGEITGDLECEGDVIIGEEGIARSNVTARNVVLAGKVHGNITARGKLTIKSSGHLSGNLSAAELAIESGGFFKGISKMEDKNGSSELAKEPSEQEKPAASSGALSPASGSRNSYGSSSAGSSNQLRNDNSSALFKEW